jgi:hypothetical protein
MNPGPLHGELTSGAGSSPGIDAAGSRTRNRAVPSCRDRSWECTCADMGGLGLGG